MATGFRTAARALVADTLEVVWPGRVYRYPPTRPTPTAGVYVGTADGGWGDTLIWEETFAVRVVADGASHAAHALLDDLLDQIRAAVIGSDDLYVGTETYEPWPADDVTELPAYTVTVTVPNPVTWCGNDPPTDAAVPPIPIGAP